VSGALAPALKKQSLDPKFSHAFVSRAANDADAAGEYALVVFDNSSRRGPEQSYRLTLRKQQPRFLAAVAGDHLNVRSDAPAKIAVTQKLRAESGVLAAQVREGRSDREIVEHFYLAALSRPPSEKEHELCAAAVARASARRRGLENVLWAILNSNEFLYHH